MYSMVPLKKFTMVGQLTYTIDLKLKYISGLDFVWATCMETMDKELIVIAFWGL